MNKYIDAEKLKEKIKRRLDELNPKAGMLGDKPLRSVNPKTFPRESELEKVLCLIDSLQQEQSEVDIEEEVKHYINENFTITDEIQEIPEEDRMYGIDKGDMLKIARHFYELGLDVRKKE